MFNKFFRRTFGVPVYDDEEIITFHVESLKDFRVTRLTLDKFKKDFEGVTPKTMRSPETGRYLAGCSVPQEEFLLRLIVVSENSIEEAEHGFYELVTQICDE